MSDREEYYRMSTFVGRSIDEYIDRHLQGFQSDFPEKPQIYEVMLSKKKGKQKLRANATYLSYCAFGGKDPNDEETLDDRVVRIATATEFLNWSHYAANWIYDSKAEIDIEENRKRAALCTNAFLAEGVRLVAPLGYEYS